VRHRIQGQYRSVSNEGKIRGKKKEEKLLRKNKQTNKQTNRLTEKRARLGNNRRKARNKEATK
jgi:hypothetical protein